MCCVARQGPSSPAPAPSAGLAIRLNQVGYLPDAPKVAVVCALEPRVITSFEVVDERNRRVFGPRDSHPASHARASVSSMVPDGSPCCWVNRSSARSCVRVVLLALALASRVAAKAANSLARGPQNPPGSHDTTPGSNATVRRSSTWSLV